MIVAAPISPCGAQDAPLDRRVALAQGDGSLRDALDRLAQAAHVRLSYVSELLPLERVVHMRGDSATVLQLLSGFLDGVRVAPVVAGPNQIVLAPAQTPLRDPTPVAERILPRAELDRAVVTGTHDGGSSRPLSVSLSVISRQDLSSSGATGLGGLLDATVPGIWSWEQPPASLIAHYGSVRGASSLGTSYPKIYIDGISVANPLLLTSLEPESIERIEVIRGPQGAALYGADAISGVVNIITRFDAPAAGGSRASTYTTAGVSNSDYASPGLAQDYRATLGLGTPMQSTRLGLSYASLGDYYARAASHHLAANAGFRQVLSSGTVTGTARFFTSSSGVPINPLTLSSTGSTAPPPAIGGPGAVLTDSGSPPQSLTAYTVGMNARLATGSQWTHNFVAGVDGYRLRNFANDFTPFPSGTDSALRAARGGADRTTLRANTTYRLGDESGLAMSVSGAAEHSLLRQETPVIQFGAPRPGELPRHSTVDWFNDVGATSQVDVAWEQRFFVTAGLRVERNDGYVTLPRYSTLPMLGTSYVFDAGATTLKLRAAFGRGMRAPRTGAREATFGGMQEQASLKELAPEQQSGIEGGFDLFIAKVFSLQVTGFDQVASGLIQQVVVPDSSGTGAQRQPDRLSLAYQNVGAITNRGWEIQAAVRQGPFSLGVSGTFVRSRVRNVAAGYSGDLRAGDLVIGVPQRTFGATLGWADGPWSMSVGATRAMDWIEYDRIGLAQAYTHFDRRDVPLYGADLRGYWRDYTGNTRLRASASRSFGRSLTAIITAENLLGYQVGEPDNATIVPGRTISTGLRFNWF